MKKLIFLITILVLSSAFPLKADNVSGVVGGTWTVSNHPYYVQGNITVPTGSALTIEAGVEVRFQGNYTFLVQGLLESSGTSSDSILFIKDLPAHADWGGIDFSYANNLSVLSYCRIENSDDGGIEITGCSPTIQNCLIINNKNSGWGGGIYISGSSSHSPLVDNCTILNDSSAARGGGIAVDGAVPTISNNIISDNGARRGGGIYLTSITGAMTIEKNTITGNTADPEYGGGIWVNYCTGNIDIIGNIFTANSGIFGGGIFTVGTENVSIINNLIYNNQATTGYGGGVSINGTGIPGGVHNIINNVIYNNSAQYGGGIATFSSGTATVTNCILWSNTAVSSGDQVYGSMTVTYSDVEGGTSGTGNINSDPNFNNPGNGDFHIEANSDVVDAGTDAGAPGVDYDDNLRPYDGDRDDTAEYDMGAYEYVNTAPQITSIPVVSLFEDSAYSYQVVAVDPDSEEVLTYSLVAPFPLFLSIVDSTGLITGTPENDDVGDHSVTIQVADLNDSTDTQSYILTVVNVNDPPVVADIPDTAIDEGSTFNIINLNNYVTDVDDSDSSLEWNYTGNVELTVNINAISHLATIAIPNVNWYGSETITFIVTDPSLTSDSDSATFTVNPINDPPIITGQSALNTPEDTELAITLSDLTVNDVDNTYPDDFVLYVLDSTNYIRVGNTITPVENFNGNLSVPVFVSDGTDSSVVFELLVTVGEVNDPPVFTANPDTAAFNEDDSLFYDISDLYLWVEDADNPDSTLNFTVNGTDFLTIYIDSLGMTIKSDADWFGIDSIEIVVSDGSLQDTTQIIIIVNSVNDPPVFIAVPDSVEFLNTEALILQVDEWIEDKDLPNDSLRWEFTVSDDTLKFQFNAGTSALTLTAPNFIGSVRLRFTATDDSTDSVSDSLVVNITGIPTSIEDLAPPIPDKYFLDQNYPNPFNPITHIKFGMPESGYIVIEVYNILGQKIKTLWNGYKPAGPHTLDFDASNISSGIYFYIMQTKDFRKIKKMIIIR